MMGNFLSKTLLVLLAISLALVFFLPAHDPDFGWHYRCGEQALIQHRFCLSNDFSYYLPDYRWAYSSFLFDLSLAYVFDRLGFTGVSLLGTIAFTTMFLAYLMLLKAPLFIKTIAIFSIIVLSQNSFSLGYRSQILGLLFFVFILLVLQTIDSARGVFSRHVFTVPILLLLWANSHPSFFLGIIAFVLYLLDKIILTLCNKQRLPQWLVWYVIICVISTLVVCINPFGWRVYQEMFAHFSVPLNTMIAEWVIPAGWQIGLIVYSMWGLTCLCIWKGRTDYRYFLLLIFAYFAITSRRNLPLYYLTFFYILLDSINWQILQTQVISRVLNLFSITFLLMIIFKWGVPQIDRTRISSTSVETYCKHNTIRLPCQAIFAMRNKIGNVFSMYEWGGFLIWQLPQVKVFVDGRMPAWQADELGRYPYTMFLDIIQTQSGWNEDLKKYGTNYLLIGNGSFLDLLLQKDTPNANGWQEEYRDKTAVIYHLVRD